MENTTIRFNNAIIQRHSYILACIQLYKYNFCVQAKAWFKSLPLPLSLSRPSQNLIQVCSMGLPPRKVNKMVSLHLYNIFRPPKVHSASVADHIFSRL